MLGSTNQRLTILSTRQYTVPSPTTWGRDNQWRLKKSDPEISPRVHPTNCLRPFNNFTDFTQHLSRPFQVNTDQKKPTLKQPGVPRCPEPSHSHGKMGEARWAQRSWVRTWHPPSANSSAPVQDGLSGQHGWGYGQHGHEPSTAAAGKLFLSKCQQRNLKNTHELSCSEWKWHLLV